MELLHAVMGWVSLAYGLLIWLVDPFACETQVEREIKSPGGDRAAVVFQIDCGATTPFNTQVSIFPSDKESFSADRYPPVLVLRDKHVLAIEWITDDLLKIRVPSDVRIFKQTNEAGGVEIIYE